MKKILAALCVPATAGLFVSGAFGGNPATTSFGKAGFDKHCAVCHPDGGNVINPKRPLYKKNREASQITTTAEILEILRDPGPGMPRFDEKTLPTNEAEAIAKYILKTF